MPRKIIEDFSRDDRSGTSYGNPTPKSGLKMYGTRFPYKEPYHELDDEDVLEDPALHDKISNKLNMYYADADPHNKGDLSAYVDDEFKMYETTGISRTSGHPAVLSPSHLTVGPSRRTGSKRGWFSGRGGLNRSSLVGVMNLYDIPTGDMRALYNASLDQDEHTDDQENSDSETDI